MEKVKLTFAGGAKSPTGSNFLIEVGDKKFLVDCGLYQGSNKYCDECNLDAFIYDPKTIDGWYRDWETDRKSTRLNSSHITRSRMPSSA